MAPRLILEAIDASAGDCLLLHYGTSDDPRLILIDGGFIATYLGPLKRRLASFHDEFFFHDEPLVVDTVVVSHIDNDHIAGVTRMFRDMKKAKEAGKPEPFTVQRLLHNSFDDSVIEILGDAAAAAGPTELRATIQGVKEGRELAGHAAFIGLDVKKTIGPASLDVADGNLTVTVVAPNQTQIDALALEWAETLDELEPSLLQPQIQSMTGNRIPNLSSIVLHVEAATGETLLLTGDARGDKIVEALGHARLLDASGRCELTVLKVPHHGSADNADIAFFEALPADHYVLSAKGSKKPAIETLRMITEARGSDAYTFHLTNTNAKVTKFFDDDRDAHNRNYTINTRGVNADSIELVFQ